MTKPPDATSVVVIPGLPQRQTPHASNTTQPMWKSFMSWSSLACLVILVCLIAHMTPAGARTEALNHLKPLVPSRGLLQKRAEVKSPQPDSPSPSPLHKLQTCKIHIMDIGSKFGLGNCDIDSEIISKSGAIFRSDDPRWQDPADRAPHWTSQHAGPYWLKQTLEASNLTTASLKEADAVFVYDYCYSMKWLSSLHSPAPPGFDPEADLRKAYSQIIKMPRFQESGGRDFTFFYSHPLTTHPIRPMHCEEANASLKLVVEAGQVKMCSSQEAKANRLIVPYSSPEFVTDAEGASAVRDTFMLFLGTCDEHWSFNLGKRMRGRIGELNHTLPAESTSLVSCELHMPHAALRHKLRTTQFCLLPPGDTPSSRRLTEIVLSGCIPVFLGSPWHTMPLADFIDYKSLGVFLEVQELINLDDRPNKKLVDLNSTPDNVFEPEYWFPDADISDAIIKVASVSDIEPALKKLAHADIRKKQEAGAAARSKFLFRRPSTHDHKYQPGPIAVDAIVDAMCSHAQAYKTKSVSPV